MLASTLIALSLLAAAPASGSDRRLWDDVLALDDAGKAGEAARARLRKAGRRALPVLVRAARASGDELALTVVRERPMCQFPRKGRQFHGMPSVPGVQAASLLLELAERAPELQDALFGERDPLSMRLALVAATRTPERLPALVGRLPAAADVTLLEWASAAMRCGEQRLGGDRARFQRVASDLRTKIEALRKQDRCEKPEDAPRMLPGLLSGRSRFGGWSSGTGGVWVKGTTRDGGEVWLSPGCSLALYEAAAEIGMYEQDLLQPLLRIAETADREQKRALALATRDLASFPEMDQNELAAAILNAGGAVERPIKLREPLKFAEESELEAAARQGNREATKEIERRTLCGGTFDKDLVLLLGFVPESWAGDRAAHIAEVCEEARGWAVAALLFREDRRAVPLLGAALSSWMHGASETRRALRQRWTPSLEAELRRLAEKDHLEAREFLASMEEAQ